MGDTFYFREVGKQSRAILFCKGGNDNIMKTLFVSCNLQYHIFVRFDCWFPSHYPLLINKGYNTDCKNNIVKSKVHLCSGVVGHKAHRMLPTTLTIVSTQGFEPASF